MKTVVITGAGSGLGRVFARALAEDGWNIAAIGRTAYTLEETLAECSQELGQRHEAFACDISDVTQVSETFQHIINAYGRIDVLINNAGISGPTGRFDEIDIEAFDATIATNVRGTFLCAQAAFKHMAASGGGRIINNGSIAAHAPRAGAASYAASKAAVASLSVSLNLDGREHGIVATEFDIGNARTELLGNFSTQEPTFDAAEAGAMIVAVANLPLEVTANQVTISAAGMPYLGRG